jgi:exonuclease VII small subunit
VSRLEQITERLRQIGVELGDPNLEDERAAELTREAAELATEASEEAGRTLREASSDG